MLHTNNPIIKHKAGLLNLAEELQNVSRACKIMGVSRDTFYRYQELVETLAVNQTQVLIFPALVNNVLIYKPRQ